MKKDDAKQKIVFILFWSFIIGSIIYLSLEANAFAEPNHDNNSKYSVSHKGDWQPGIEACREANPVPKIHYLPLGIGDVKIKKCFNYDHRVLETKNDGTCHFRFSYLIKVQREDSFQEEYVRVYKEHVYSRHKYICYYKGAGVVLAQGTQVRKPGDKILFQGEEPKNFRTKDPACSELVDEFVDMHKSKYGFRFEGLK